MYMKEGVAQSKRIELPTRLSWASTIDKTKLAILGTFKVLGRWQYTLLTLVFMALFGTLLSLLSTGLLDIQLLASSIDSSSKLAIIQQAFLRLFSSDLTITHSLLLVTSLLQGIAVSLITFNIREQKKLSTPSKNTTSNIGRSSFATILATLGAGCATCGTSLVVPIISLISSSAAIANVTLVLIPILAILLLIYSIWSLGHTSFMYIGFNNVNKRN